MKRIRLAPLAVAATLALSVLVGCAGGAGGAGSASGAGSSSSSRSVPELAPGLAPDMATADQAASDMASKNLAEAESLSPDAHVISSAEVRLQAQHPDAAADDIAAVVTKLGGSVEALTVRKSTGDSPAGAELSVRVPPQQVDAAIASFGQIGDVVSQSRSAQDVTTQYVDLEARIKALETSVKRLNDLMAGAATTSELIEAEGALTQRQQELDGLRAQFEALDAQVSQATIWVSISAPHVLPGGGPGSFWEGFLTGVDSLIAAASGALVLLGVLLPWLVVATVIAAIIVVTVRSRKRRRARVVPPDDQIPTQP